MLVLFAMLTPLPWGGLWLIVPLAVMVSLLTAWRHGGWGVIVPIALFVLALAVVGNEQMWVWWVPFAALTGAWMGLREEGGGPGAGDRAWMLLPLLLLAATLPWTAPYQDFLAHARTALAAGDAEVIERYREIARNTEWMSEEWVTTQATRSMELRDQNLHRVLPSILFLWMVLLVTAGRSLSARAAGILHWPPLSRAGRRTLRLPDGALWILLIGVALWLSPWRSWDPTAWTLIINGALAFCVQGVAVVESLLLARGLPPSLIVLTMVFVFAMAWPMFMVVTAAVGISDVWLDYRRIETPVEGNPRGD